MMSYHPDAKPFEVIRRDSTAAKSIAISEVPTNLPSDFNFQLASFDFTNLQLIGSIPLPLPQMPAYDYANESPVFVKRADMEAAIKDALQLCYTVEKIPGSTEQTEASVAASALYKKLDAILNPYKYV